MNERITYLWEQANIRYNVYETAKPRDERKTIPDIFSQMIVQECAKVCLAQRDPANLNYKPSERFAEAVKQHFGVEE